MILDSFRLDGQVALVTGGGRGIGQGAALAEAGADVALLGRADASETVARIGAVGRRAHQVRRDLAQASPAHTHDRRTECYLYFDLPADARVVHLLGERRETRHLIVADRQAVISPSWSLHFGVGTAAYSFVWAMVGENQAFDDMDPAPVTDLR